MRNFMKKVDSIRIHHRRKLGVVGLVLSLLVLAAGFLRLAEYTVPMFRHDWSTAAVSKYQQRFEDPTESPLPFEAEPTASGRVAEWVAEKSLWSVDAVVGDRVAARFNQSFKTYKDGDNQSAITQFQKAYSACFDSGGKVRPEYRELASNIQHLIGNAYFSSNKIEEAASAYKLSLTLNPDNKFSTYMLERIQGGGGKGDGGDKGDKPKAADHNKI